jgi:hypothetical protein
MFVALELARPRFWHLRINPSPGDIAKCPVFFSQLKVHEYTPADRWRACLDGTMGRRQAHHPPDGRDAKEGSSSFLKKRTKKLLFVWLARPV